jgi:N-acyl-D-aspartate/D-glutamate deacylase
MAGPSFDLLLRGARVIDGTGKPGRAADVAVRGDRIAAMTDPGQLTGAADVVDLDGLVLAPGFIDIHTHYDAQVLWDPDLTPSSWHGITTVVMGNCGFGIAPTRPEHRSTIARTLENVEGMSVDALEAGIPWTFETFPQYLDAVAGQSPRLNVAAMIGHTPLRLYVMGDDAVERPATGVEIEEMRRLVAEALTAGAVGFATSRAPTHAGAGGRPVPSRQAEPDEVFAITQALAEAGRGIVQITPGPGLFLEQFATLSKSLGRPISWTALLTGIGRMPATDTLERGAAFGGDVWPQIACRPLVMQVTLEDPFPFAMQPAFKEILAVPRDRRGELYADPAWRERARPDLDRGYGQRWGQTTVQETTAHEAIKNGPTLAAVAAERGVDPFDLLIDLSLAENLKTRFRIVLSNDDDQQLAQLLRDPRTVLGLSDAGAHASQLCDACFSTHLLEVWSRERGVLSTEEAVWRLTGQPAGLFGLTGRGTISDGSFADLVAFDPDTVAAGQLERVWDLPAGADRLVSHSAGIDSVWVNGVASRRDGKDVDGARAGVVIRGGMA